MFPENRVTLIAAVLSFLTPTAAIAADSLQASDIKGLYNELKARGAIQAPAGRKSRSPSSGKGDPSPALKDKSDKQVFDAMMVKTRTIFGSDTRVDLYELQKGKKQILRNAEGVVAFMYPEDLKKQDDNTYTFDESQTLDNYYGGNLCSTERFRNQPCTGFCTGFLVAPDIVATAGHCSQDQVVGKKVVFGFKMLDATKVAPISADDVYECKEVIKSVLDFKDGSDWALLRLDRPVANHPVLKLRRKGKISDNARVYGIGHPSGLPAKYTGEAGVKWNDDKIFFQSNVSIVRGNSGGPLFNAKTHEVEGIVVRQPYEEIAEVNEFSSEKCKMFVPYPESSPEGNDICRLDSLVEELDKVSDKFAKNE